MHFWQETKDNFTVKIVKHVKCVCLKTLSPNFSDDQNEEIFFTFYDKLFLTCIRWLCRTTDTWLFSR